MYDVTWKHGKDGKGLWGREMPKKNMVVGGPGRCLSSTAFSSMLPHRAGHPWLGIPCIKLFYQYKLKGMPHDPAQDGARFGGRRNSGIDAVLPDPDLTTWFTTLSREGRLHNQPRDGGPQPIRHLKPADGGTLHQLSDPQFLQLCGSLELPGTEATVWDVSEFIPAKNAGATTGDQRSSAPKGVHRLSVGEVMAVLRFQNREDIWACSMVCRLWKAFALATFQAVCGATKFVIDLHRDDALGRHGLEVAIQLSYDESRGNPLLPATSLSSSSGFGGPAPPIHPEPIVQSLGWDNSDNVIEEDEDDGLYGDDLYIEEDGGFDNAMESDHRVWVRDAYMEAHPDWDGEPSVEVDRVPGERWNVWHHTGDLRWSQYQASRMSSGVCYGGNIVSFADYDALLIAGSISETRQVVYRPIVEGAVTDGTTRGDDDDGSGPPRHNDTEPGDGGAGGSTRVDEFPLDEVTAGFGGGSSQVDGTEQHYRAQTVCVTRSPGVAVEVKMPGLTIPYVARIAGSDGYANLQDATLLRSSFALYDLTDQLGGGDREMTFASALQYKNTEFRKVLNIFAPIIRELTGEDFFYRRRYAALTPASWTGGGQKFPPVYPQRGTMPRFGVRFRCDFTRVSGCDQWLEIGREFAMDHQRPLYSLRLSNGMHRHACNHFHSRHQERLDPESVLPALHPAVDHFIRGRVREAVGQDPVTYSKLAPLLKEYLRDTQFVHCGLPHPTSARLPGQRNEDSKCTLCWHSDTYATLADSPYFAAAARMPPKIQTRTNKRVGKGGRQLRDVFTTRPDAVTLNHMMLRQGESPNGRGLFDSDVEAQIKLRVSMYNTEFGFENGPIRLEGNSMEDFWKGYEKDNLHTAWSSFVESTNPDKHFDVYQWRVVGLLYRKRAVGESGTPGLGSEAPLLSVDDFAATQDHRSCGADHGYEMIAVLGSLASLAVSWKAWACRNETGGVVLGLDHMYNFLKGTSNVCNTPTSPLDIAGMPFLLRDYVTRVPVASDALYHQHLVSIALDVSVQRGCDRRQRPAPSYSCCLAAGSRTFEEPSCRVYLA